MNFYKLVTVEKSKCCKTCHTYNYHFNVSLTKEIKEHLELFGDPGPNFIKTGHVHIDNDAIQIMGLLSSKKLKVKYKQNAVQQKFAFEMQMASYINDFHGFVVSLTEENK